MEDTMNRQLIELVTKGRLLGRRRGLNPTPVGVMKALVDKTFPDVGTDCSLFPVIVVLFSAALLGTEDVGTLCAFTRYGPKYVGAIAENMTINHLWICGRYDVSQWVRDGFLDEDISFGQHIQMAIGDMWCDQETADNGEQTWNVVMMDPAL
jgi:hypothetical protein